MTSLLSRFFHVFAFLLLSACASDTQTLRKPVPVEDRTVDSPRSESDARTSSQAEASENNSQHPELEQQASIESDSSPMLVALLDSAESKMQSGESAGAAALIERALRLKPKSAILWHRLATIRLQQKNWQQVINLAKKSNSLASNQSDLRIANWQLMASAYASAGNSEAANYALNKARTLDK